MSKRYSRVAHGERIKPRARGWRMACCDCGLVHIVSFSRTVHMRIWRDDRASGAMRRGKRYAGLKLPHRLRKK